MICAEVISTNIICSLGSTTDEVFAMVADGQSGLNQKVSPVAAVEELVSCVDCQAVDLNFAKLNPSGRYTKFEKMAILSIADAAERGQIDMSRSDLLIILSTTKGNICLLDQTGQFDPDMLIWNSAKRIAQFFSNQVTPVVISNACISGVSSIITASRYLMDGKYQKVVVVGCDVVSRFVLAGFASFKALSHERCRPFDKNRDGLNIGEAAATMILQRADLDSLATGAIYVDQGAITNDATHISAPSRTGQGLLDAISRCDTSNIDFVQLHGTATPYNDQMEAVALGRANLDHLSALSLKWHFGHTLGAAGVVETIVGCKMLDEEILLPSKGCELQDENCPINLSTIKKSQPMRGFLKTISGFGGCNAALVVRKKV